MIQSHVNNALTVGSLHGGSRGSLFFLADIVWSTQLNGG